MFETVVLLAQILSLSALAAWLTTGVWDNILHPENNETFTAQVMEMVRMRDEYPAEYARVAHRAVSNRFVQNGLFRLVVLYETVATGVLWAGIALLALAWAGAVDMDLARAIALLGALMFTSIWAGFLVIGNYFCYWFCHYEGQTTHYLMTLWGMANMIFLVVI